MPARKKADKEQKEEQRGSFLFSFVMWCLNSRRGEIIVIGRTGGSFLTIRSNLRSVFNNCALTSKRYQDIKMMRRFRSMKRYGGYVSLDESYESLPMSIGDAEGIDPGSYSIAAENLGSGSSFGDKYSKPDMKRSMKKFWSRRNKVASDVGVVNPDDQIVSQWKCSSRHSCRRFALLHGEMFDDVCDLKKVLIKRCMEECGM